jgi:chromosome partitioning protein
MIITVTNQKGGVGKTTIACNLVTKFLSQGHKALLVDADPQKTSMDFRAIRSDNEDLMQFTAIENCSRTLHQDVAGFKDTFDYIVIDSGGRDSNPFRSSLMAADIVLTPIIPSSADFWGSEVTFDIIMNAKAINTDIKVFAVFNLVKYGTVIEKEITELANDFESRFEVKFLKNKLYDRIVYKHSLGKGKAIFEMDGKDSDPKANREFEFFYKELLKGC